MNDLIYELGVAFCSGMYTLYVDGFDKAMAIELVYILDMISNVSGAWEIEHDGDIILEGVN